jgi:hypothetical protein
MRATRLTPSLLAAALFVALVPLSANSLAAPAAQPLPAKPAARSASEQSLFHTTRLLAAGDVNAAKVELHRAERALHQDTLTNDQIARAEATRLLRDARQLETHLKQGDADSQRLAQTLWRKSAALAERRAAYLGDAWPRVMHDHPVKSQLIDARLYLHYASIEEFTAHNQSAADEYLNLAQTHVSRAHEIAFRLHQPVMEIVGVQKHIAALAAARSAQRTPEQFKLRRGELSVMIDQ